MKFPHLTEYEGSLPSSQKQVPYPYPEPEKSTPRSSVQLL